jgi:hypothetical protein
MGIWKNLRAGAAFMRDYQQDTMETVPRWARVVRVGRQVLGTVGVDVEIHYGQTPPHVESVSVSVPRGMRLQVGQDVFVVGPKTSSDSSDTTWILDVTRPPQYGSWPTPPEFLTDAPPVAASPAAAPPGLRESRLKILQVHLRQGTITREDYVRHLREMRLLRDGPESSHDTGTVHVFKCSIPSRRCVSMAERAPSCTATRCDRRAHHLIVRWRGTGFRAWCSRQACDRGRGACRADGSRSTRPGTSARA